MSKKLMAVLLVAAPVLAQAADDKAAFVIAAYGDSTTAGVISSGGRNIITKNNEMNYLHQMLKDKYGADIQLKNHGSPGAQAAELVYSQDNKPHLDWAERMAKSDANMILLNYGINDARIYFFKDKKAHQESPEEYKRIMTELVKVAKAHNKLVVLQEPNPICGRAERWNVWPYVYQLNEVAKEQQVPIVKQFSLIKENRDWQSEMSPDCIHPSEMLYKQKAQRTFDVLSATFDSALSKHSS